MESGIPPRLPDEPLAPPRPSAFTLPLAAWLVWGLFAAGKVALFALRSNGQSPYAIGELLGEIVGMLVIPALFALLFWRLGGRSARAGSIAFFVVFALTILGQLAQSAREAQARRALAELRAERERAADAGTLDEKQALEFAQRASEQLHNLAENTTGSDRVLAQATKAYMDHLVATKRRYDDALQKIGEDFWNLEALTDSATVEQRREAVAAFTAANAELKTLQDPAGTAFRRSLETQGVPARLVDEALAGYLRRGGPRLALMEKVRETDARIAAGMGEFLDFGASNAGKWKTDSDGSLLFDTDEMLTRYQEIIANVQQASAEQEEYQKQLAAPGR